ncbi:MAG: hypothetical protein VYE73_16415 [Acidobacteriota bacterium]|nr:hypothetical protein [Acidobacteriota bacterium]
MSSRKMRLVRPWSVILGLVVALVMVGCGASKEEVRTAARAEEYAALQTDHAALGDLRQELAAVEAAAQAEESEETDGEEGAATGGQVADLTPRVHKAADEFSTRLVNFINEHAGFEGEEPHLEVAGAITLKSSEDIVMAQEYIVKGGDYGKAIEILASAKIVDPDNAELQAALSSAESMRYMDEERFSQVEKGMSQDEVRSLLGQVKHQNVRKYDDQGITAWFYPKDEGAAAAVFYRERGGELKVYDLDFEAVKTAAERAG